MRDITSAYNPSSPPLSTRRVSDLRGTLQREPHKVRVEGVAAVLLLLEHVVVVAPTPVQSLPGGVGCGEGDGGLVAAGGAPSVAESLDVVIGEGQLHALLSVADDDEVLHADGGVAEVGRVQETSFALQPDRKSVV